MSPICGSRPAELPARKKADANAKKAAHSGWSIVNTARWPQPGDALTWQRVVLDSLPAN